MNRKIKFAAADPKKKPLSIAVDEVYHGKVKIVGADED